LQVKNLFVRVNCLLDRWCWKDFYSDFQSKIEYTVQISLLQL